MKTRTSVRDIIRFRTNLGRLPAVKTLNCFRIGLHLAGASGLRAPKNLLMLECFKKDLHAWQEACTGDVKCMLVACSQFCGLAGHHKWKGEEACTGVVKCMLVACSHFCGLAGHQKWKGEEPIVKMVPEGPLVAEWRQGCTYAVDSSLSSSLYKPV